MLHHSIDRPRQLSVKEAAAYLGISEDSVRSLYTQKLIKHRRIGPGRGVIRFEREWLDDYLESTIVEVAGAAKKRPEKDLSPTIEPSLTVRSLAELEGLLG